MKESASETMDCIGAGAGPSNLSLGCFLHPYRSFSLEFLEQKDAFRWHPGMLLPGASIQVSFLKDLVTLVDPCNRFSFLSFLRCAGRLQHFLNARFEAVERAEFDQYFRWVAEGLGCVRFSHRIREIVFKDDFIVRTDTKDVAARNVVVGVGLQPSVPGCVHGKLGEGLWHSSQFQMRRSSLRNQRVAIIGGGQSGAEIFLALSRSQPNDAPARIDWICRRANFLPLDDSPFVNEYFVPSYVEHFVHLPADVRKSLVADQKLASDGISSCTLGEIYRELYHQRFLARAAVELHLYPGRELRTARPASGAWELELFSRHLRASEVLHADTVILCTGYKFGVPEFLEPVRHRLQMLDGEIQVGADYAAVWDGPGDRRLYVQNGACLQRGIADPNLSLVAWRSALIANSLLGREAYQLGGEPSFLDWSRSQRNPHASPVSALRHEGVNDGLHPTVKVTMK